jgi:hypothetical protein
VPLPRRPINVLHGSIAAIVVANSSAKTGREDFGKSDRIPAEGKGGRVNKKTLLMSYGQSSKSDGVVCGFVFVLKSGRLGE